MPSFSLEDYHEQQLPINLMASGLTVVIPAKSNCSIHVCKMLISGLGAENYTFYDGASNPLSGPLQNDVTIAFDFQGALATSEGNAFGISLSGATTVGGWISFYYLIESQVS